MEIKFHGAFVDLHAIDATLLDGVAVPESRRSTEPARLSLVDFHTDYDNRTALHLAAAEGHLDAVGFRVEIKFTAPSS